MPSSLSLGSIGAAHLATTTTAHNASTPTADSDPLLASILARLGRADEARRKYVLRDLLTASDSDGDAAAPSGSEEEPAKRRHVAPSVSPALFREGVDDHGVVPAEVLPTEEDTTLYAEDRARLDTLDRVLALFLALTAAGELFVLANFVTGAAACVYASWLRERCHGYLDDARALRRASVVFAARDAANWRSSSAVSGRTMSGMATPRLRSVRVCVSSREYQRPLQHVGRSQ